MYNKRRISSNDSSRYCSKIVFHKASKDAGMVQGNRQLPTSAVKCHCSWQMSTSRAVSYHSDKEVVGQCWPAIT